MSSLNPWPGPTWDQNENRNIWQDLASQTKSSPVYDEMTSSMLVMEHKSKYATFLMAGPPSHSFCSGSGSMSWLYGPASNNFLDNKHSVRPGDYFQQESCKKAFYAKLPLFKSIKYYANINFIAECWVCSLKSKIWWSEFANKIPILKSEFVKDSIEMIFSEYFCRSETYDHVEFLNVLVCFMWGRQNILHSEYMVKFEQSLNAVNCPGFLLTLVNWFFLTKLINDEMEEISSEQKNFQLFLFKNKYSIFIVWFHDVGGIPVSGFKGLAQAQIHVYKSSIFNSKSVPFSSSSSKASRNSKMNRLLGFGKF